VELPSIKEAVTRRDVGVNAHHLSAAFSEEIGTGGTHPLCIELPKEVYDALAEIARREERTVEQLAAGWFAADAKRESEDSLLRVLGSIHSDVTEVAERHDEYIG